MGYYTQFQLEYEPELDEIRDVLKDNKFCPYSPLYDVFCEGEPTKWYDHEDNMRRLSSMFPDVLFTVKGVGEEMPDIWVKYFKGGKCQYCKGKVTYDPFDETKLE